MSWQSRLQKCVALSTIKAKYIAITETSKELLWMKKFLQELGLQQERCLLYCDSQSVIHLSKNPTFHSRFKHIDVRYHWICDALEMKLFFLEKIHIDENGSDMMTKPIPTEKLQFCRKQAGMVGPFTQSEGEICWAPSYVREWPLYSWGLSQLHLKNKNKKRKQIGKKKYREKRRERKKHICLYFINKLILLHLWSN